VLRPYYRNFELPWEADLDQEQFFRKLWTALLGACLLIGFLVWLVDVPERPIDVKPSIPPRLAKIVIDREIPPPPPPPPPPELEQPKPEPQQVAKVEPRRPADTPPVDDLARTQQARKKAAQAGLLAFQDELADIRQQFEVTKDQLQSTANTTGVVDGPSTAERSLITSKVGTASGGISMAGTSRGFGSGAGNLGGKGGTNMVVPFGGSGGGSALAGRAGDDVRRTGSGGKASRSREEIELVFDRNKGAIYALYSRALRDQPELSGKMVLEFTISPTGEVTMCRIVSSELDDPELERKIVARVRLFRFEARDVEAITTTKPIDFFPA
jgi:TonB family protein